MTDTCPTLAGVEADAERLRKLATELRNVPRICLADPLELVVWLARRAAKLDAMAARMGHEGAGETSST